MCFPLKDKTRPQDLALPHTDDDKRSDKPRYDYFSKTKKKKETQFPDRATIPVSRVKMRIHAEQPVFSSGGRSRFRLNYMRSPAVNHTSPRQPAFTPSPRQHQWGPIPSTGDRRAQKTTVSLYSLFDIQCMRSSVVFRHMSLRGKRAMDRCGMSTHLSICVG